MVVVNTVQGKLKGSFVKTKNGMSYFEFLNIPYAKPPVGVLRFKSPQAIEPWQGEKDARTSDNTKIPFQRDITSNIEDQIVGTEDCLYLNVYTPVVPTTELKVKLPVMVYFHGGGFIIGNGTLKSECGPEYLLEHNVVLVSINYRLNVFGFLTLNIPEAAGNMGLKDQNFALRWIKNNIKSFSGDNNNVTVFGVSAGAASAEYHIISPFSKGLLHKAILQSGTTLNHWALNYEPQILLKHLLLELNFSGDVNDKGTIYNFLLYIDGKMLAEAASKTCNKLTQNRTYFGFVPTIEQDFGNGEAFLTIPPYIALRDGKFDKIPVIRGHCNKEGYVTQITSPNFYDYIITNKQNLINSWPYPLSSTDRQNYNTRLHQEYFVNYPEENTGIDFCGHFDFIAGVHVAAKLAANQNVPQYVYEFSYDGSLNFLKTKYGIKGEGACHVDDLGYLLGIEKLEISKIAVKDELIRRRLTKMWTNFAKYNNPTPTIDEDLTLRWPEYTKKAPVYFNIGQEFKIVSDEYEPKKIAVFEEIYSKYEK